MLNVIIVDDEVGIISLIKSLIDYTRFSIEVIGTAGNGEEALKLIREKHAVNHGFEKISENGLIKIRIFSTQSSMKIIVTDNGQGISQSKLESIIKALKNDTHILMNSSESQTHTGIALYNINKRLKFYYGEKYGLNIYSTEKVGTSVELILPLLNKESLHD